MSTLEVSEETVREAVSIFQHTQRASTSCLQRRMRIGYTHAWAIMDELESRGLVGPPRGSEPREMWLDKYSPEVSTEQKGS